MTHRCSLHLILQSELKTFFMGQPRPLFVYFRSFQQQFYRKIVDFSGNRTQIVGVEGEHADH